MDRRDFLSGLGVGALSAAGLRSAAQQKRPTRRPNIIFILADDLGYGGLGCYGQQKYATPNIDRLARDGKRFTNGYAASTVCAPSRCSLMTGMHQGHASIRGNRPNGGVPLPADDLTVAELLRQSGYRTAMFGKWGLGLTETTGAPNKQGFDEFFGYTDQVHAHRYFTDHLWRDGQRVEIDKTKYTHDLFVDEALRFIRENRERPFFLYLPLTIPHAAIEAPEDEVGAFRGKFPETPFPGRNTYPPQATPKAAYAAMMTRLDRDVGRVTALLDELKLASDTVVFFSSDNGPAREGGADPEYFQATGPFRGIKRDLYEGGIRVPFIVRWKGKVKPGTIDQPVAFYDVLPTLAEIAGVSSPENLDGISFLPTLTGKGRQKRHNFYYWEFYERGFQQAVRYGDWKGLQLKQGEPIELYDLKRDPAEKNNVAAQNLKIVRQIEDLMRRAHVESPLFPKTRPVPTRG